MGGDFDSGSTVASGKPAPCDCPRRLAKQGCERGIQSAPRHSSPLRPAPLLISRWLSSSTQPQTTSTPPRPRQIRREIVGTIIPHRSTFRQQRLKVLPPQAGQLARPAKRNEPCLIVMHRKVRSHSRANSLLGITQFSGDIVRNGNGQSHGFVILSTTRPRRNRFNGAALVRVRRVVGDRLRPSPGHSFNGTAPEQRAECGRGGEKHSISFIRICQELHDKHRIPINAAVRHGSNKRRHDIDKPHFFAARQHAQRANYLHTRRSGERSAPSLINQAYSPLVKCQRNRLQFALAQFGRAGRETREWRRPSPQPFAAINLALRLPRVLPAFSVSHQFQIHRRRYPNPANGGSQQIQPLNRRERDQGGVSAAMIMEFLSVAAVWTKRPLWCWRGSTTASVTLMKYAAPSGPAVFFTAFR